MARGTTQMPSGDGAQIAPGMGHNGPPTEDVINSNLNRIQEFWRTKEASKQAYQADNARYRRGLKDAKAMGLNEDAILDMIRVWQLPPAEVTQRLQDSIAYMRNRGMPIGTQLEIFGGAAGDDLGNPADLGREKVAGRKRHGTRVMEKNNPYPKGSWQAREFERGWIEGARA